MARSRKPTSNKQSENQAASEAVKAPPEHAANAKKRANNEPDERGRQRKKFETHLGHESSAPVSSHRPQSLANSSAENPAERQRIIDRHFEDPQPPVNSADALILFHASISMFFETGLHPPNAKRIQYFLDGEFVGKPSHVVVSASYELARLSQKYGIADSVRKAVTEFRANMFGPKDVADESQDGESSRSQGRPEATGATQQERQRDHAAESAILEQDDGPSQASRALPDSSRGIPNLPNDITPANEPHGRESSPSQASREATAALQEQRERDQAEETVMLVRADRLSQPSTGSSDSGSRVSALPVVVLPEIDETWHRITPETKQQTVKSMEQKMAAFEIVRERRLASGGNVDQLEAFMEYARYRLLNDAKEV